MGAGEGGEFPPLLHTVAPRKDNLQCKGTKDFRSADAFVVTENVEAHHPR